MWGGVAARGFGGWEVLGRSSSAFRTATAFLEGWGAMGGVAQEGQCRITWVCMMICGLLGTSRGTLSCGSLTWILGVSPFYRLAKRLGMVMGYAWATKQLMTGPKPGAPDTIGLSPQIGA